MQRFVICIIAVLFFAAAAASLHFARHAANTLNQFIDTRLAEDDELRGIELTLAEAAQAYWNMRGSHATPLVSIQAMGSALRGKLISAAAFPEAKAAMEYLDTAQEGFSATAALREKPHQQTRADLEATAQKIREAIRQARIAGQALSNRPDANRDLVFGIQTGLRELADAADNFLLDRPDPMPEVLNRLDTIRIGVEELSALPQWSEAREQAMLQSFKRTIYLLMGTIAKQSESVDSSQAQVRELWDAALRDIGAFRTAIRSRLRAEGASLQEVLTSDNRTVILACACGMTLGLLAMLVLHRLLNRRVQSLREGAGRISQGDLSHRLPAGPKDPFGQLAQDFNAMAESLENKNAIIAKTVEGLKSAGELLEQRVQERTFELRQALDSLRLKDSVFEHIREGILITQATPGRNIIDVNPAFTDMMGYSREELLHLAPRMLHSDKNPPGLEESLQQGLEGPGVWDGEIFYRRKDGSDMPVWLIVTPLRDEQGRPTHYVGICRDITEQHKARETITRQARYDFLTGLANRGTLMEHIERSMSRAKTENHKLAVLFLDLDNFKSINDKLGHAAGDALLKQVSTRLAACVRGEDIVARLGGDEFVVLASPVTHEEQATTLAKRILTALRPPFDLGGSLISTTASIGVSVFPEDGQEAGKLLSNADKALYQAKAKGKANVQVYTAQADTSRQQRQIQEKNLLRAVQEKHFEVHYQPLVLVNRPVIIGAEALVRWKYDGQLLTPSTFIPLAEELNVIQDITDIVLAIVRKDFQALEAEGLGDLQISVNVSPQEFTQASFVNRMAGARSLMGNSFDIFGLDITQTALMRAPGQSPETVRALREMGFYVAVDDFDAGASSYGLRQYPLSTLKIDRQFIMDLENKSTRSLVRAAISMAKGLGLMAHAEGVETQEQLEFLRECGCDFYQGFLFSPALPSKEFRALLAAQRQRQGGQEKPVTLVFQ